jgi:hypothetical protein
MFIPKPNIARPKICRNPSIFRPDLRFSVRISGSKLPSEIPLPPHVVPSRSNHELMVLVQPVRHTAGLTGGLCTEDPPIMPFYSPIRLCGSHPASLSLLRVLSKSRAALPSPRSLSSSPLPKQPFPRLAAGSGRASSSPQTRRLTAAAARPLGDPGRHFLVSWRSALPIPRPFSDYTQIYPFQVISL